MLKVDGVLVGGEKLYIEEDSNIGVLSFQWCAGGWLKIDRGSFTYWCAGALMVCWLAGKKVH